MSRYVAIPGYEGRYSISADGDVVSFLSGSPRQMSAVLQGGYRCVGLRGDDGRRRYHGIHRLLLMTFVRLPQEGEQARHLNDVRLDNRLSNLAWGSPSDNMQDCISNGRNYWVNRTHCSEGHEFTQENTRWEQGEAGPHRRCLTCRRAAISRSQPRVRRRETCLDCGLTTRADGLAEHRARRHGPVAA